jgi:hypothetical protein
MRVRAALTSTTIRALSLALRTQVRVTVPSVATIAMLTMISIKVNPDG